MIEYLEQLVEEKKYREALDLAEQLMKRADDPHQVVRIYAARVVSHCRLGEEQAALAGGDFAMSLAKELGDWDSFGIMALWVGVAYCRLGQLQEAVAHMYDYLGRLNLYQRAASYEQTAWYNLGIMRLTLNEPHEGATALSNALKAALRIGDHRYAHGVRQSLIDAYLRAGVYEAVPRLLAQCGHYLRKYPDMQAYKLSWANHIKLRGEYALVTGRANRTWVLATGALHRAEGEPVYECLLHLVLAKAARRRGVPAEAMGHGLAARTCSVASRRADLEAMANDLLHQITQACPDAVKTVDQYYTSDLM